MPRSFVFVLGTAALTAGAEVTFNDLLRSISFVDATLEATLSRRGFGTVGSAGVAFSSVIVCNSAIVLRLVVLDMGFAFACSASGSSDCFRGFFTRSCIFCVETSACFFAGLDLSRLGLKSASSSGRQLRVWRSVGMSILLNSCAAVDQVTSDGGGLTGLLGLECFEIEMLRHTLVGSTAFAVED